MSDTEKVIKQAIQEAEEAKKARKAAKAAQERAQDATRHGKTLEEIEAEEGGPIKESLVGMAQTKRAAKRKADGVGDTDLVEDVEGVEEELAIDEEDGIKLEAFNMKEERQKGYFDEVGNYVENNKDDEEEEADAWLGSDEAKVVDAKTRQKIEEQQRKMQEAEAAGPLTAVQIARLQWQVARILKDGETVTKALKRLGAASGSNRPGYRPGKRAKNQPPSQTTVDPTAKEQFNQLTEAASTLIDAGETDVYEQERSYFKRCAAVYIDVDDDDEDEGGKITDLLAKGVNTEVFDDDNIDEDMFADEDEGGKPAAAKATSTAAATAKEEEKKEEQVVVKDTTDYASWPIKELRRFLQERGVDSSGLLEKAELVAKVKETAAKKAQAAPPGYAFDPSSGMWFSQESQMYWDQKTGGFFNPADQKWYSYSADGQWVEWK